MRSILPGLLAAATLLLAIPTAVADDLVDQATLADRIRNLGYQPTDLGQGWGLVQLSRDGTDYPVAFKAEGDWIRFETFLTELPPPDGAASAPLVAVLMANSRVRPAAFYVDELQGTRRLIYSRSIPRRGAGPVEIRLGLEAAVGDMAGTKSLWQNVEWSVGR